MLVGQSGKGFGQNTIGNAYAFFQAASTTGFNGEYNTDRAVDLPFNSAHVYGEILERNLREPSGNK